MDVTAVVVAVMVSCSTYLILTSRLTSMILGFGLLSNAINLLLLSTSRSPEGKGTPIVESLLTIPPVDPVPQALILTAIVIGFALIAHFIVLCYRLFVLHDEENLSKVFEEKT